MYDVYSDNKSVSAERVIRILKENIMVDFNKCNRIWIDYIDRTVKHHNKHENNETKYTSNKYGKKITNILKKLNTKE